MAGRTELIEWMDATATTALSVQLDGETQVDISRPLDGDGWYGIDGSTHFGKPEGGLGLPFRRLADGVMAHDTASAQKSVVAVLVEMAIERDLLGIDDAVSGHLGRGWSRSEPARENTVTLRHLLTMTSGLSDELETEAEPGSRWSYSLGPAWHLLKPVLVAASGRSLDALTVEWLTGPLGMNETEWIERPGMTYLDGAPFEALSSTARDLSRFGELVLQGGRRDGASLLGVERVAELLRPSQEHNPAYGMLWWLNGQRPHRRPLMPDPVDDVLLPSAPADVVMALGALGQIVLVAPSRRLVAVRLGGVPQNPEDPLAAISPIAMADELWSVILS